MRDDFKIVYKFAKDLNSYRAQLLPFSLKLIGRNLFPRIDAIRQERTNVVHQFWLDRHRGNRLVLRKKFEKLGNIANELVGTFNKLTRKTGVDEVYELFL